MRLVAAVLILAGLAACATPAPEEPSGLDFVKLPPGFRIDYFARQVPGARSLARGDRGTVFVGTRDRRVYALPDADADGRADAVKVFTDRLSTPNGVAVRDGDLYVGEIGRILRYDGAEEHLDAPPEPAVVTEALPKDRHHGWKFLGFGPDGLLYVPVGAPCNVCEKEDPRYASILRMKPDGSGQELFASGVRNTVGFDWQPGTKVLWFTDNGRDLLGDDQPPDELNRAPEAGLHFGFPYVHGGDLPDPEFGRGRDPGEFTPPAMKLGPHVASLGMRFYTGSMFPEDYRGDVLIAEHGSWNRTTPLGYRVTRVHVEGAEARSYQVFAEGWLGPSGVKGRPVDLLVLPDGSVLVSDDHAGCVYRISCGS